MNWFARNMIAMLFGVMTSLFTTVLLIYVEAHSGETMFSLTAHDWIHLKLMSYVPVGAILAGSMGAVGYLLGALALRLRPGGSDALVILGTAACMVFLVQSAEFSLFMGGADRGYTVTRSSKAFSAFLGRSMWHTPLRFWSTGDSNDDAAIANFFNPSASGGGSHAASSGDGKVDDLGGGVQGLMSTQDVSNTSGAQHFAQVGVGIESLGTKVQVHGGEWMLLALQTLGFAQGGLLAFFYVRSLPHCKGCMLLLNMKGKQTRYFSRSREMRSSVDEVLMRARDKQLQQSIHLHIAKGSEKQQSWSEYCSTVEILRCMNCRTHRMVFHAQRKQGATWKDIDLLAFSTNTLEPVDFA
jgi:hypothetical protein